MIIASVYPFPFFIGHGHDVNFSLIKDGEIFSCEEGKITSTVMNQYDRFPERSMIAGFKELGISAEDVDIWVFGNPLHTPVKEALTFFFSEFKTKTYDELKRRNGIRFIDHHQAHVALAVYGSGFDRGMFLTLDDGGDEAERHDSTWGIFDGCKIRTMGKSGNLFGLTTFHNFLCDAAGYLGNVDNGKAMGLAAYGRVIPKLYDDLHRFLTISSDGFSVKCSLRRQSRSPYRFHKFRMDAYHRYKVVHSPNPPKELKAVTKYYSAPDIAATGQKVFEDMAIQVVSNLLTHTGEEKIVCSGGTFQNINLNRRLLEMDLDGVYIPMAPNDAGLSLGAALAVWMPQIETRPETYLSPYLGPSFSNQEISRLIDEYDLVHEKPRDYNRKVAQMLADGKVIGWFQGRCELGPRALGARSVLADPRKIENKALINQYLKRRDWFMPYAPSVTLEAMDKIFKGGVESPYMTLSFYVKDGISKEIPAAIHVDQTCRPNSVRKEQNPKYYELIKEFEQITGIPMVLNTSFNRHGIATIVSPRQAFEHLMNGCFDGLAIGDYLVFPERQSQPVDTTLYAEKYFLLVEELMPIINAICEGADGISQIIAHNKNRLMYSGISFNPSTNEMMINGDSLTLRKGTRKELYELLFPFFGLHENDIWPNQ